MRGWTLVLALALVGCRAAHRGDVREPPRWQSQEGRDESRIAMADALARAGDAEQALAMVALLRREGVKGDELDLVHARALRRAGLLEDAEGALRDLARRRPRLAGAWDQLGVLLLDTGRIEEGVQALQRAARLAPDDPRVLNNLGFALLGAGQSEAAIETLRRAILLDGSDRQIRNNLGFALIAAGRADEALRVFRAGMSEADARYNLALGVELQGQPAAALDLYAEVLRAWPGHAPSVEALQRLRQANSLSSPVSSEVP